MSDDSFIREVNEEMRQDQARALWNRYGIAAVAIALTVVVATAAWIGYRSWNESRANASGDAYSQALTLAAEGRNEDALAALEELRASGHGAYPVLARMRAATLLAADGNPNAAVEGFDAVAADSSVPAAIRDMARLRAALLLVDHGSYADVSARVEALAVDTNPVRHSAREALGLSAWKEGRAADALALFQQIEDDQAAPRNLRQRAGMMVELIRGSGAAS